MKPVFSGLGLLLAACVTSTDTGSSNLVVKGTWDYTASQTAPTATLAGTLTITAQAGGTYQGSASVVENDGGSTTPLAGPITGQAVNDTTVDFDVFFDANARRHVATVVRDTMRGGWFESEGSTTLSGSFLAVRRSGP
jgi:hypothetical protein